ncbi:MAG: Gldg family protein, partial [Cryomorphaceae bacterium]|nr:Gldg family protein [Cryomorphaceae bacterium]
MKKNRSYGGFFNWTFLAVFIAGIVLVNIIASLLYVRIDMTEDRRYSLSDGTVSFLENKGNFENRLNIKIYLEGNLPAELKQFRNTIEDKLKEFKEYAGNRIEYQFIDPTIGTEAEQQALWESIYAKGKGIIPMDVVYSKDGAQSQILVWPGALIEYGGSTVQNVQFMPGTPPGKPYSIDGLTEMIQNSINNLEYILISSIRRATAKSKPRIAFLQGHGELTFAQTQRARALISPYFSIADIEIKDSLAALDKVDGLVIARPRSRFSDKELYIIDQFVMRGGRLMCFLDVLNLNEDSLNMKGMTHTTRNETGLERMLFDYGIKINDNYLVDVRCAPKAVPFAKQSLIPWFFHVLASPTKHPISRNLEPVGLKFASEIQFVGNSKFALTPVLTTSTNSNVTGLAPLVNLAMPLNYTQKPELVANPEDPVNKRCVAGLAEGFFDSHFKNRIVEEFSKNPLSKFKEKSSKEGKVFVVGNGRFIANSYDSMPSQDGKGFVYRPTQFNDLRMDAELAQLGVPLYFGNQEFFQNLTDYMMGENSVLDIRSRQIDIHAMDSEKVKTFAGYYQ